LTASPKPRGRPSKYSDGLAEEICGLLAEGQSLVEICRSAAMPARSMVYRWLAANEGFRDRYARAREAQADRFADEILEIADDARNDWVERQQGEETIKVVDHEHIQRSRLRVDARKWLMAKLAPKKYGDSVALTGGDGGPLVIRWEGPPNDGG
jgi:hypothetical protein